MAELLHRVGTFAVRKRWTVVIVWLVLLVGIGAAGTSLSKPTDDGFSVPGTESQQAIDLLGEKFPGTGGASARVVVKAPAGHTLTEATYLAKTRTALAAVAKAPQVLAVTASLDGTLSDDETIGFADIQYAVPVDEITDRAKDALQDIAEPLRDAGMQVDYSGGVIATSSEAGHSSELYGMLIGFLVLLITFGSLVAAGMPLIMALVGVGLGLMGLQLLTSVATISSTAPALATMLGLAVGIDYTLFIISRHKAQRAAGMANAESIALATATAGGAVVFAGLTVIIALAALAVLGIPFLAAMGFTAAATVALTVLVAVTLVPAVLALLGDRIDKGRIGFLARRHSATDELEVDVPAKQNMGERWGHLVTARPVLTIGAVVLVCAAVALPLRNLSLGLPDDGTKSTSTTERRAYDLLTDGFGPGFNGPLTLVLSTPGTSKALAVATSAKTALGKTADVALVSDPVPNQAGDVAILSITPESGPSSKATKDLVQKIRDAADEARASAAGVDAYVTGQTAVNIDVSTKIADALPVFLALIVGLALLLLLLVFRSILVPIKAVGGFLLSIGASMGMVVWVFQEGHLGNLFNVETPGPVLSFLPVLLIGILFGLAMDYEVFLVSRIREDYLHTNDPTKAITSGMHHSARVVTAAGLIMLAVFGSFILGEDPITKSIGLALAIGVFVDAFLVRMTLVPAILTILGRRAWALPGWLDRRLPDLDIEGTRLERSLQESAAGQRP